VELRLRAALPLQGSGEMSSRAALGSHRPAEGSKVHGALANLARNSMVRNAAAAAAADSGKNHHVPFVKMNDEDWVSKVGAFCEAAGGCFSSRADCDRRCRRRAGTRTLTIGVPM